MGLGRRSCTVQLPPTSREVLPVRPPLGTVVLLGDSVAWGSQMALQMSGVRWGSPFLTCPSPLLYTGLGPLCPRNQPSKCPEQEAALGETNEARGRHRVLT